MDTGLYEIVNGEDIPGKKGMQEDYIDFINNAFGFTKSGEDFRTLLPKLFGKGRETYTETTFAIEKKTGKIAGTVGRFPVDFDVCGTKIRTFGIGNVAAREDIRNQGIMSALMKSAVKKMIEDGADLSFLGGSRLRYNNFGFERCGAGNLFAISNKTFQRMDLDLSGCDVKKVENGDREFISYILQNDRRPYKAVRHPDDIADVLRSWRAVPYCFVKDGDVKGWAAVQGGNYVAEFVCEKDDIYKFASIIPKTQDHIYFYIPEFDRDLFETLFPISDSFQRRGDICFNVFNYEKVAGALLRLKSAYMPLAGGRITISINGSAGHENIEISVNKGIPKVQKSSGEPDIRLDHLDAMNFFFTESAPVRTKIKPEISGWFPLPIFVYHPDEV